jgi:hypothetical protein
MSDDQQDTMSGDAGRSRMFFWLLCLYLIGSFLWRVLTPAHEYPMRDVQVMTIVFDVLIVVGLISMKSKDPKLLFWTALIAGVGLLAIRLNSDASWWTGHLMYSLPPR